MNYKHDDFGFTTEGDLILDFDPRDDGSHVGWDLKIASKVSRDERRTDLDKDGTHPNSESLSLKTFYLETLRSMYPGVPDTVLETYIQNWGYIPDDYYESLRQNIRDRCKTTNEDWRTYPQVGADLEEHIGQDINTGTVEEVRYKIFYALTRDNMIVSEHLNVTAYRGDAHTILFLIEVRVSLNMTIREVIPFSFVEGPYLMLKGA